MSEDEVRARLARQPLQVLAVPCWQGRCENAGLGAEFWVWVEADTETVAVDRAARVLYNVL